MKRTVTTRPMLEDKLITVVMDGLTGVCSRKCDLILFVMKEGCISLRLLMSLSFYNWGLVKKCQ